MAVGSEREVERFAGPRSEILDAGGRLVLPGFIDAHVHLIWGYELGTWIDLTDRPSLDEIQRRVAEYGTAHPDEEIIVGQGFDYASLKSEGVPGKEALDVALDDRPVLLLSYDGHTGWGNTRLLERALSVMKSASADVGEMVRAHDTGEPTGIFHRIFDLMSLLPEIQRRQSLQGLQRTVEIASRFGITTAFDVQVNLEDLHAYEDLRKVGGLTVRIRAAIHHPRDTRRDRYPEFITACERYRDDWYQVAAVKLYIDGVQETGTAALIAPYENDSSSRGPTVYPVKEYTAIVAELDCLGFQICTHACGDRGVRIALDAYARAAKTNRTSGRCHRIEHCENLDPADYPRFAELGVVPCMMPRHAAPETTVRWREAIGPERTRIAFPWRELLDHGADLAFASDWPVANLNPLTGIHEAVTRRTPGGEPSPHRISVREAVDGYTRRAAYACFAEATRGTIAVGKYADFVVLSHDLFEIPPSGILETRVIRTVIGARTVHSEDSK